MKALDQETLKSLVMYYRDEVDPPLTFQDIADKIKEEYDVSRTRQAIHAIYVRALEEKETRKIAKTTRADVINLYCIGYNMTEIKDILGIWEKPVSYNSVRNIVEEESENIKLLRDTLAYKALDILEKDGYIEDIKRELTYKDFEPIDKELNNILVSAYSFVVISSAVKKLVELYQDTKDSKLIGEIIKKVGIDTTLSEIKQRSHQ